VNVFAIRDRLIADYANYVSSFLRIRDQRLREYVDAEIAAGLLWPDPLIQLNPSYEPGTSIDELADEGTLHEECRRVFRFKPEPDSEPKPLRLHLHQEEAIRAARTGSSYILTTGTGSGKSLAYMIPIVDHVLRRGPGKGIQAIIVYPMNALVNSQMEELKRFLQHGYPDGRGPVTYERYTGQESDEEKNRIMANPPDILLTNYVMLELILTRPEERRRLIKNARGLQFLVLDELHTYRGRQGADVAMLVRRVRDATESPNLQCVGTSATLAGEGTYEQKKAEVATIASQVFGTKVAHEHVIGETLQRASPPPNIDDPVFIDALKQQVLDRKPPPPTRFEDFASQPLSSWIETSFGLKSEPRTGRLLRRDPRGIWGEEGAAKELSQLTSVSAERCGQAIQDWLQASYQAEPDPQTGFPVFAFRLHQFISRGDTAYATLETEEERYITVHGQQFVPGDRSRVLLPLVFCRECGQEYYAVYATAGNGGGPRSFVPRDFNERQSEQGSEAGYLLISTPTPWPENDEAALQRLPEEWLEDTAAGLRVRLNRREHVPEPLRIRPDGREDEAGTLAYYVKAPFRFCLNCAISYDFRQRSDFAKLSTLGSEGRSTATTILSLSTIQALQAEQDLPPTARKLLSFTDNRQDASLQAGHFNDFVEVGVLRSALYRAVDAAGSDGLDHAVLPQKVFDALDLPLEFYAADPSVRFLARDETEAALREVLAYRLYHDLRRGWRITSPNLEQCGLLKIEYKSLADLCQAEEEWNESHLCLAGAPPDIREEVAKVLLDFMRRELVIKVDFLDRQRQEQLKQRSSQRLRPPWAIDEDETLAEASILFPRSRQPGDYGGHTFLSARGGFGQYLRRGPTFPDYNERLSLEESQEVISQLLRALRVGGLVKEVLPAQGEDQAPGYQLPAAAMVWRAGDGTTAFHDPIRVPGLPEGGGRTNPFFVEFYRIMAGSLAGIEAKEHTAQVPNEERETREQRFRTADLPILFCSPTMELGVDIALLNVVNLRNIPPTPANYSQRSGRAGRSGQPALVFSYCSTGSSHDQYFFKRPELMVSGAVSPPRLDLANEDLIRAHVHAIWLAETGLDLGTSLRDLLEFAGEPPSLELLDRVRDSLTDDGARRRAKSRAEAVLLTVVGSLEGAGWHTERWLDEVFDQLVIRFEDACRRWRSLYRAAYAQREIQSRIIVDHTRPQHDHVQAIVLRREAESQLDLLTDPRNVMQSDFYSYRYFASEGFLPGYNFPRLPLSAYIPGRRLRGPRDEYLSRPRFLAISEFGPRAVVYHEGSRYIINKVILPVDREGEEAPTSLAKQCGTCGYLHPITEGDGPDLCEFCGATLEAPIRNLFRLQNVSTRRRDRINCDEEERLRMGFELRSGVRFSERGTGPSYLTGEIRANGNVIARLTYGHAATIWRINLGWRRRQNPNQLGFLLDMERGYWARNEAADEEDPADPMGAQVQRVVPYVEDHKNCLILEPASPVPVEVMASLQAALKDAIQVTYQLEDSELAVEPLPERDNRRSILFYEAAEGGAGVLRRLIEDNRAFPEVARAALAICHFDPDSGQDLRKAPRAKEECEAACYDCLMSYMNQLDHPLLDRQEVRGLLLGFTHASVHLASAPVSRAEQFQRLKNLAGSDLEVRWLDFLEAGNYRLPSHAQHLFAECKTRPDFLYQSAFSVIYVDGRHHDYPDRAVRDDGQSSCMEDLGYTVIRFGHSDNWQEIVDRYPGVFGARA
jgi:ATP-dependent helicase YprA (DUF1998 family)